MYRSLAYDKPQGRGQKVFAVFFAVWEKLREYRFKPKNPKRCQAISNILFIARQTYT